MERIGGWLVHILRSWGEAQGDGMVLAPGNEGRNLVGRKSSEGECKDDSGLGEALLMVE